MQTEIEVQHAEDCPRLGDQRVCHVALALCQQGMGKERLGAVVVIGSTQSPGANQEDGGNNQGSSVGNIERCCFGSK